jgi:hypothetical protein
MEMSLKRYANTDEQEEALAKVEKWAEEANFNLRYGTCVGKHPQGVILDHKYQDGFVHINRDGEITIDCEPVETLEDFKMAIKNWGEQYGG